MAIEVGGVADGKVTGVTKFGAFIDLGEGKVGLVHISQISNTYVKEVSEHIKVGDPVKVKIIGMTKDGKYDLSIKQLQPVQHDVRPRGHYKREPRIPGTFEEKINAFLKESDEKLLDLKKNIQNKQEGPKRKKIT